jgi:hypothetical protein
MLVDPTNPKNSEKTNAIHKAMKHEKICSHPELSTSHSFTPARGGFIRISFRRVD